MTNRLIFESKEEFYKFYDDCMFPDCPSELPSNIDFCYSTSTQRRWTDGSEKL